MWVFLYFVGFSGVCLSLAIIAEGRGWGFASLLCCLCVAIFSCLSLEHEHRLRGKRF